VDPTPDRIIRDTFSDREDAVPFFRSTLPSGLLAVLDLDTLEVEQGNFIDESMKEYRTDVLFRIQTASGSPAKIYLLFEHKSQRDPRIFTQLLSYLARIYERQDKPVPVIPFVFYHGKKAWDLGTDFTAHFTFSETERQIFAPYLPDFRFELFDLGDQDVETLTITLYVKMLLQIIRSIDTDRLDDNLRDIFELSEILFSEQKKLEKLRKLIFYVLTRGEVPHEKVASILSSVSKRLEKEAMTAAQKLREEGFAQGMQQGMQQGLLEGEQKLLIKQMEWRFGSLSKQENDIIRACSNRDLIEAASRAILEGKSKDEVLASLR
jgi:predicted transposase/invertase (TIGR01784 family)